MFCLYYIFFVFFGDEIAGTGDLNMTDATQKLDQRPSRFAIRQGGSFITPMARARTRNDQPFDAGRSGVGIMADGKNPIMDNSSLSLKTIV
jgi:hypothetical protein